MKKLKNHPILIFVVVALIVVRMIAPGMILRRVNKTLDEISPLYTAHVVDLDISIIRMAYRLEKLTANKRGEANPFFKTKSIDVSLAWRELLKLRLLTDIEVNEADVDFDKGLALFVSNNTEQSGKDAKNVQETLFPVNVERLRIHDSKAKFRPFQSLKDEKSWRLTEIEATARNLTPKQADGLTLFTASAKVLGNAPLKVAGEAYFKKEPASWKIDAEMHGFDMRALNSLTIDFVPISFNRGDLEIYSEVRSENGKILGYVKPFAKDLDIVGDKADFGGVKQFFVEILSAFAKTILKNRDEKTVATQIDFGTVNGEFKINTPKAISEAFKHGFSEPLDHKVDNALDLKTPKVPKEKKK